MFPCPLASGPLQSHVAIPSLLIPCMPSLHSIVRNIPPARYEFSTLEEDDPGPGARCLEMYKGSIKCIPCETCPVTSDRYQTAFTVDLE